jgi:hypothetical protein
MVRVRGREGMGAGIGRTGAGMGAVPPQRQLGDVGLVETLNPKTLKPFTLKPLTLYSWGGPTSAAAR